MSNSEFWVGTAAFIASAILFFGWLVDADWFNKLRYSMTEDTSYDRVDIRNKPHDCEFMTAPLGEKHCHYERAISKVMWSTSTTGEPIMSLDSGRTWEIHKPGKCLWNETSDCPSSYDPPNNVVPKLPTATGVIIRWDKVED
jgi:hypothetical protein